MRTLETKQSPLNYLRVDPETIVNDLSRCHVDGYYAARKTFPITSLHISANCSVLEVTALQEHKPISIIDSGDCTLRLARPGVLGKVERLLTFAGPAA